MNIDPELEPFLPFFPPADLSDPVTARKNLAELAASVPAPDTAGMQIEDRTVPAEPDVAVRIYRPHQAQGAIIWLRGGGFVMGDLDTDHPAATRVADGYALSLAITTVLFLVAAAVAIGMLPAAGPPPPVPEPRRPRRGSTGRNGEWARDVSGTPVRLRRPARRPQLLLRRVAAASRLGRKS